MIIAMLAGAACGQTGGAAAGPDAPTGAADAPGASESQGATPDAGDPDVAAGAPDSARADGGGSSPWVMVNAPSACPRVLLGTQVPVQFSGTTAGLPNWIEDRRLNWREAPDDSLLLVVPEDGEYVFRIWSDAAQGGVGASAHNAARVYHTEQSCPRPGAIGMLDGYYTEAVTPLTLRAGQRLVIWVSAASWESVQAPTYTIRIEKKPG